MAAHLSAVAWRGIAKQREKAGELEPIKLATSEQRAGAPLAPRKPPEPWARFVGAVDAYLPVWEKHPDFARRAGDRSPTLTPWQAALIAAEVEYANDRMEEARRRLQRIVETWPGEADVMENAVQLLLQTYLVTGDDRGLLAMKDPLKRTLEAQAGKAEDAKAKAIFQQLRDRIQRTEQWLAFTGAKRLFDAGSFAEAAEGFERFAAEHASSAEASSALWNAALAWEKVEKPEKAAAAREAIVAKFPDSAKAPMAALYLASGASRRGDHEAAARHYLTYIERWPEAPNRCVALQNVGFELDVQGKAVEAAERYLAFGSDARCAKERPNEAAKGLCRGGKLFTEARQKGKAREAFEAAARVEGVTDASTKKLVEDARKQAKKDAR
jgi:tetratricopeptide (TPR) repeat protein